MNKVLKSAGLTALVLVATGAAYVAFQSRGTESDIQAFERRVAGIGADSPIPVFDPAAIATLPDPVQRYFRYTFQGRAPSYGVVRLGASGDFRRPLTEHFNPTTANQVIAAGVPALMFSATTPMLPGIWARAYDFFADGEMEMKAKILSAFTVVDESETPELNRISLRRWLLESALYPASLLPGGPVTWEAVDERSARAIASWAGMRATMIAHFDGEGRMTQMAADADGDLATPYHGSGEHVARSNYQLVGTQMIPLDFTISRMAGGKVYPFWQGTVQSISFH
ncbi:MAG: DUF6544 family protein [Burkholderiaceae bacterium]